MDRQCRATYVPHVADEPSGRGGAPAPMHADYVEDEPPPGMGPGRDGLRQWLAGWIAAFPDVRWTVEEQIADEDRVWSRSTWQGTHQGSFLGIPPTGKNVTVAAWTIDRFTDGKIAESRIIRDALGMMQQLGVIPAPDAGQQSRGGADD